MTETTEKTQLLRETLRLVNNARKALGEKPLRSLPAGSRHHSRLNPISRALKSEDFIITVQERTARLRGESRAKKIAEVWGQKPIPYYGTYEVKLPNELVEFLHRFDRGEFPHLDIGHIFRLIDRARVAAGMEPLWLGIPHDSGEILALIPGFRTEKYIVLPSHEASKVAKVWGVHVWPTTIYPDNDRRQWGNIEYRVPIPKPLQRYVRRVSRERQ